MRFTEFRENFHHQHQNVRTENGIEYGDLPKFVDYDYTANVARLNAATLASLASAPAPPADVQLLTKALENDSTLEWKASPGGLASGYEVLWRDTTAADWQHVQSGGQRDACDRGGIEGQRDFCGAGAGCQGTSQRGRGAAAGTVNNAIEGPTGPHP